MTLVIKSTTLTAPEGAEKLYRDALVSEGTLLLFDFSNRGTLDNFNVSNGAKVYDLAREAGVPLGVDNTGLTVAGSAVLSADKGINFYNGGVNNNQGIYLNNTLLNYLYTNQPHCIMTIWAKFANSTRTGGQLIRSFHGTTYSDKNVRAQVSGDQLTPTFGGCQGNPDRITAVRQISIEFTGIGNKCNIFSNGVAAGQTNASATGFTNDSTQIGLGQIEGTNIPAADVNIYRIIIEDLSVSGRTAAAFVTKDWNYCKALGEFNGIEKRPWVS